MKPPKPPDPALRLFVGHLPFNATDEYLREFFEESGYRVDEVMIVKDQESGRSRGFAFVTFPAGTDIKKIIETFNGQSFMGQYLTVNEAKPKNPPRWSNTAPDQSRKR